ncbi:osmoprotectant transport system permease protein [Fodinibius salinus]|uniref:Osmoprotectant transport system permease protein n=1 Tax=Fodinibius salinus TaxID=860790 RepID=A0A5D3YK69_9BACT|nr:ABC transporter permease/substrate-binding protein [Fodinibius salinus]TYP93356.1 osmoprotectant transport system permease protein [Fodinibius salinus]
MVDFWNFLLTNKAEIWDQLLQHIGLTAVSLLIAVLIGIPLGLLATRYKKVSGPVLGTVGIIQTIPSIALLGFMLPLLGIGALPAVVALFLYALLPIVRNTYSGIQEVESSVIESARGMGMTSGQILRKVELPLAGPVIFAGIRTATVINVGVATLCALIGAGGLGEYIFRGIALNNSVMILAGALPAALLALTFDFVLGLLERNVSKLLKPLSYGLAVMVLFVSVYAISTMFVEQKFKAGVPPEFLERADGYQGLKQHYGLDIPVVEMNASLMYEALKNKRVDVIVGYSTDGRIKAFNLKVLKDDKQYFPPYQAAPIVKEDFAEAHPKMITAINKLAGKISTEQMTALNSAVDNDQQSELSVAKKFLNEQGFRTSVTRKGTPDLLIGGKLQTEQFILAHMYRILIENYTDLDVELRLGLAGTQIVFTALQNDEIQLYPEYTGTGLHVLFESDEATVDSLGNSASAVFDYVKVRSQKQFDIQWLEPIGFENTYALIMRKEQAKRLDIETISDLADYLSSK